MSKETGIESLETEPFFPVGLDVVDQVNKEFFNQIGYYEELGIVRATPNDFAESLLLTTIKSLKYYSPRELEDESLADMLKSSVFEGVLWMHRALRLRSERLGYSKMPRIAQEAVPAFQKNLNDFQYLKLVSGGEMADYKLPPSIHYDAYMMEVDSALAYGFAFYRNFRIVAETSGSTDAPFNSEVMTWGAFAMLKNVVDQLEVEKLESEL